MSNSRRNFWAAPRPRLWPPRPRAASPRQTPRLPARRPAGLWGGADVDLPSRVPPSPKAEKAHAVRTQRGGAQMAAGNWRRPWHLFANAAPGRADSPRRICRPPRLGSVLPATGRPSRDRFIRGVGCPASFPPATRTSPSPARAALPLDRSARTYLRAAHPPLSRPPGTLRSQVALRHHAHAGLRWRRRSGRP